MWGQKFYLPLSFLLSLTAAAIPAAVSDENGSASTQVTDTSLAFSILPVYPSTSTIPGASMPTVEPTTSSQPIGVSTTAPDQTTEISTTVGSTATSASESTSGTSASTETGATSASGTESAQPSQTDSGSGGRQLRAISLPAAVGLVAGAVALL